MIEGARNNKFSVSRIPIEIAIEKKGIIKAQLIRHLAPLTISEILKNLPLKGNAYSDLNRFYYLLTNLELGAEKQKKVFNSGDISYLPSNGAICFFVAETETSLMNYIGKIISNMDILIKLESTDILTVREESVLATD